MNFWTDKAGLFTIGIGNVALHILPKPRPRYRGGWLWGYKQDWYDGPLHDFGVGPLLLVCWF